MDEWMEKCGYRDAVLAGFIYFILSIIYMSHASSITSNKVVMYSYISYTLIAGWSRK